MHSVLEVRRVLQQRIFEDIEVERIEEHVRWLTAHAPNRISSGRDVGRAAEYVAEQLELAGLRVQVDSIRIYNSTPLSSRLDLLAPVERTLESLPCGHIRSTPPAGEVRELVFIEAERYLEEVLPDVRGKMVLVEMSYEPTAPEKARLLHAAGAAGLICMNWGSGGDAICNRALKTVWGNPTEVTLPQMPNIVGLSVTRETGLMLRDLCLGAEPVTVRVSAVASREWQAVAQPWGILRGSGDGGRFMLAASHLDAWSPGVTCNATGNAMTLEIARVLALHREELARDVWFAFWNGHEIAEAAGSTWFLDHHWDALDKGCTAYIHIDSPGLRDAAVYEVKASEELQAFAQAAAESAMDRPLRTVRLKRTGDQSFMGIGIPSLTQRMSYSDAYLEEHRGAFLGWWNHTAGDTLDKYDRENMLLDCRATLSLMYYLSTLEILPYDLDAKFARVAAVLAELDERYGAHLALGSLAQLLRETRSAVARVTARLSDLAASGQASRYNDFAMAVLRLVSGVFQTHADKYGQDSYGFGRLSAPLPLLADLRRLERFDPASFEYGLIETQLLRNRNRIADALKSASDLARLFERSI